MIDAERLGAVLDDGAGHVRRVVDLLDAGELGAVVHDALAGLQVGGHVHRVHERLVVGATVRHVSMAVTVELLLAGGDEDGLAALERLRLDARLHRVLGAGDGRHGAILAHVDETAVEQLVDACLHGEALTVRGGIGLSVTRYRLSSTFYSAAMYSSR